MIDVGTTAFFWSSAAMSTTDAYELYFDIGGYLDLDYGFKSMGQPVRCVR
jgi:hypothetical protein